IKDGPLAELPFSLLKVPGGQWLVETHAITTAISASSLVVARRQVRASRAPKPFFGIGHPIAVARPHQQSATIEQTLGIKLSTRGLADLAELPEAGTELKAFATAFGSGLDALLMRDSATPKRVRETPLSDYRVISFATHALLPGQHMLSNEASIVLSPPAGSSDPAAALLTSSDIAGLKLDADVVILSACNTAAGNDALGGDRLGGLARAFFTAGARSVVVTHWAVHSAATQNLMTRFASHYKTSPNASAALRAAMLGTIKDANYSHPYFWAAFDIVG
ncbi:MAG: CHAT domain-containing protein, partial [Hyphomicrobium sp.]